MNNSIAITIGISLFIVSCSDLGDPPTSISSDAELFQFVTQTDPYQGYRLFPNADSVTSGTLNGSTAHQPLVRVSMNATAFGALVSGRLPSGSTFPGGSVIFKEVRGTPTVFAVIYKDPANPHAASGWLWAEYLPDGTPFIPLTRNGAQCIGCHSLEQGPTNDFVRTFERQYP